GGPRVDQGGLRGDHVAGTGAGRRCADLPASLPGVACRRGVPGVVRRRTRGLRGDPRHPRAAAGHDRQRRQRLHDPRAPAQPDAVPPETAQKAQPSAAQNSHHEPTRSVFMTATPDTKSDVTATSDRKLGAPLSQEETIDALSRYGYGWVDPDEAGAAAQRGLSEDVVRDISAKKNEPDWMLAMRLRALRTFGKKPMPTWGSNLDDIDFDNTKYFVRSSEKQATTWDDLPEHIRNTDDKLGIPEAEKQRLVAGVAAQYE